MADAAQFDSVRQGLIQPDRKLYFAPIRHHSPACAWAVRELIREVRPKRVLIEAPVDLAPHIELLLHEDTRPPVAIASILEEGQFHRLASYFPLCAHSPEYIALVEGHALGTKLEFIDLPSADKAMLAPPAEERTTVSDDERYFNSGHFVAALCDKLGCRDGFELWDHLFESRLADGDWKSFLADVGAYCAGLRSATAEDTIQSGGDADREAHMRAAIAEAVAAGEATVVVTGGFHTPALIDAVADRQEPRGDRRTGESRSYLIRYGFSALDALNGYSAGLPQPGYYDYLWQQANDADGDIPWSETALGLVSGFGAWSRAAGHTISVPAQVEMLRVAEGLARMKGRRGPGRHDLIDGARSALIKGEIGLRDAWTERLLEFLRGDAIGDVPASAGSPPIVEDARDRARRLRIDVSDGSRRRRRLDIRRKKAHLEASRYFHAMTLLNSGFAEQQSGPDFVNGVNTERLFEEWSYAWSPTVEGRLIEYAVLGDDVMDVCAHLLVRRREALAEEGQAKDIAAIASLFVEGVLAGLSHRLGDFLRALDSDIRTHGEFEQVARTLIRLLHIDRASGPLGIPDELSLDGILRAAFQRIVYLCEELPNTPEERIQAVLEALRSIVDLLRDSQSNFDNEIFDDAIDRVADRRPPPEILGALLAICVQAGRRNPNELAEAITGNVSGTVDRSADRIGVLRGMLVAAPELLWRVPDVLASVDEILVGMDDSEFLELLPHIRLAFAGLNPRESDRLAQLLVERHGGRPMEFTAHSQDLTETHLRRGLAAERSVRDSLSSDGIGHWLEDES
ncbi:MAG: DUF5682 family protein [Woeseiaceae bacterium]|nr:DUF5682 family protein [Woeseiaceae bacterium]